MTGATLLTGLLVIAAQAQVGWDAERTKALQLRLDNRTAEAVAVLEGAVTRYPREAGAHYELADAMLEQVRTEALSGSPAVDRSARLERVATLFRRAMTLDPQYRQLAAAKLVSVYEEDGFERPGEVERLSRDLMAMDAASGIWAIKLAHSLAAQQRCGDAGRVLVDARATVDADRRLLLGMSMTDLFMKCSDMPLSDARPLLESAEAIAAESLKTTPDDRDVVLLQAAALTALASRLPEGPEKSALEARGAEVTTRFMDLNPGRQAALRGEAPERVYDGFAYLNEFLADGKIQEADQLLASMKTRHAASAEFWSSAAFHHQQRGERDEAIASAKRHIALVPSDPMPHALLAGMYVGWAMDEAAPRAQRLADLQAAQAACDAALQAGPTDTGALIGQAEVLKAQAALEQDPVRKEAVMAESRMWAARGAEAYKAQRKP
jgi:tetratricopeptide (TPR) repeat protein